jgi:hypothetical protein
MVVRTILYKRSSGAERGVSVYVVWMSAEPVVLAAVVVT